MEKDNKKETEGELEGRILKTEAEYIEGLGPVISLMIGFRRVPNEEKEKNNEN